MLKLGIDDPRDVLTALYNKRIDRIGKIMNNDKIRSK